MQKRYRDSHRSWTCRRAGGGEPFSNGFPAFPWGVRARRIPLAAFLDDLLSLDAATLDKTVEMKINFYAAHLDKTDWG
jgi:hypothetical protein